jgi:hypothetical protein
MGLHGSACSSVSPPPPSASLVVASAEDLAQLLRSGLIASLPDIVREATVRARLWTAFGGALEVLAVVQTVDVGAVPLYATEPCADASECEAAAARLLQRFVRRLDGALVVESQRAPVPRMTAMLVDRENQPLTSFAVTAEQQLSGDITVVVPDTSRPAGREVRRGLPGFPDTDRLIGWFQEFFAGTESLRAVAPSGRAVRLGGHDMEAYFEDGQGAALLHATLTARVRPLNWEVLSARVVGPGVFEATIRTEDAGEITNVAAVSPYLGAERGALAAAEWFQALLCTRIEPGPSGDGSQWLVACASLDRRWHLGGVRADNMGTVSSVRGIGDSMESDITLCPEPVAPVAVLHSALLVGYRGPDILRVVDPSGRPRRLPIAPTPGALDDQTSARVADGDGEGREPRGGFDLSDGDDTDSSTDWRPF